MSQASIASPVIGTVPEVEIPSIPVADLAPWAAFVFLAAAVVLFFISADQGAISIPAGTAIHEWVHDGRHLLGFPCH
ncbi:MAG: CbtB domain-containing protein [Aeromicrobium sp.]